MATHAIARGDKLLLELDGLAALITALEGRGYQVIGPTVQDGAIVFDALERLEDLPAGWTAVQQAGSYRLKKREDQALFGYGVAPRGLKRFFHPANIPIQTAERDDGVFRVIAGNGKPERPFAFLGVRACDLAAVAIQDRVLLGDRFVDTIYKARREGAFFVAVNCTEPAPTCFCASMGTGPQVEAGYDLVLTELVEADRHIFLLEVGSDLGAEVATELKAGKAPAEVRKKAQNLVERAPAKMVRKVDTAGIKEMLYDSFEHPRWEQTAARCLACTNCTMVCPTCFCITVEDSSDVTGHHAERIRKWDSCFSQSFSYIHGGSVRMTPKSRYRQWLSHKFGAWIDQFGTSGCVGCGRCITWCPVGIDVTEELAAIRGQGVPAGAAPAAG